MHLPVSVTQDELLEVLLQVAPVRPVFIWGAPGIGKSTLLLQICACLCQNRRVLYISGEESERQLKLRAQRLQVQSDRLFVLSETRLGEVLGAVEESRPDILIADSIQTLYNLSLIHI